MSTEIVTFGCRLNAFESAAMRGLAAEAELDNAVVVNTCAVTAEAERQARQAIRRARRVRPDATVIVTGCAAQIAPERWSAMPEVDRVVGNAEKLTVGAFLPHAPRTDVGDIMAVRGPPAVPVDGRDGRTRAHLQVQQGCDHRCTFCVIPFGRGPNRSVPLGRLAARLRRLAADGVAEVVLTGVDITGYGADLPGRPSLGAAVRRLLAAVPELPRLRLSSLDPAEVDRELLRVIAGEPRLMPHFHLSVQAGDDMILKRMRRRHGRDDVLRLCARIRGLRPDAVFGADLIAGFPTETEDMFARSLDLIDAADLTWLHVFPFSPRSGTPAARMPQVPPGVRRDRARRLREAGAAARGRFLAGRIGREERVVVERAGPGGEGVGRSEQFAVVSLDGPVPSGSLVRARTVAVRDGGLFAEAVAR